MAGRPKNKEELAAELARDHLYLGQGVWGQSRQTSSVDELAEQLERATFGRSNG